MIGHIDLDIVVYAVGAACDGKRYTYRTDEYQYKSDAVRAATKNGDPLELIHEVRNPEPWENVRKSCVSFLEAIISSLHCGTIGYLSGKSNFRYDIATILPYKGNRKSSQKPFHYDAIRQFLVDSYDAKVSVNMEADDLIGLSHDPEEDIIVTKDKDLNCVPGLHFNWSNATCYYIFPLDADKNFYSQCLTGDRSDNILGVFGIGKESDHVKNIKSMSTDREMFDYVLNVYRQRFGEYSRQFFKETAKLLWILQKRNPQWEIYFKELENEDC